LTIAVEERQNKLNLGCFGYENMADSVFTPEKQGFRNFSLWIKVCAFYE
jgi:hypothetical protein